MNHKTTELHVPSLTRKNQGVFAKRLRTWLPSRGNVIFTLVVVACLFWASKTGAISPGLPAAAGPSTGTIAYQGRLADASGTALTGTYIIVFRLYNSATGGSPLWEESWTGGNSVQVNAGLFNVLLGSLTPIPQSLINGNSSLWLGIDVGTDAEMTPRVQLSSVPYAFQSQHAERANGLSAPDGTPADAAIVDNDGNIGIGTTNPGAKLGIGGQGGLLRLWNEDAATVSTSFVGFSLGNTNSPGPQGLNNWLEIDSFGDGYVGTFVNGSHGGDSLPMNRSDIIEADGESMIFANYFNKPFYFYQGGGYEFPSRVPLTIAGNGNIGIGTMNPDATLQVNGTMKVLGNWDGSKTFNTIYQAPSDGFVLSDAYCDSGFYLGGITDSSNTPSTERISSYSNGNGRVNVTLPVRKGDYWEIYDGCYYFNGAVNWIPFGN